jgi:hypothetical protein
VRIELDRVVTEREPRSGGGAEISRRVGRSELDGEAKIRGVVRHDEVVFLGPSRVERHGQARAGDLRQHESGRVGRNTVPDGAAPAGVEIVEVAVPGAAGAAATGGAATTNTAATPTRSAIDRLISAVPGGGARSTDHRGLIGQAAR